ncbi:MAG TPA: acyl-CoA dehydrogenase [Acidimicrobiales bacterium]|nr:acyl-CoA dehydrogenase [Acidimicrobiales bacterium]
MSIAIGEDHLALLHAARRFTGDRCAPQVARAAVEAATEARPPFWDELAGLGWLSLAVPEADGGQGHGFGEQAVVLEELGRSLAPGPMLPTVWAAAVIDAGTRATPSGRGAGAARPVLPDRAAGRAIGAVALDGNVRGDGTGLSGSTGPVLGGALADLVVVPVHGDGHGGGHGVGDGDGSAGERWWVVAAGDVAVTPLDSLDPTRRLARLDLAGVPATALPAGLTRERVTGLGAALAAAECAGGAAWCVATASAYATVRRQFGRPIGQFQAVKHRCADMLVRLEQVRAVAWDAALALDGDEPPGDEAGLAAATAGAVALEGFADVAKDCIQVLGGIGFTWEHDAHLYLRRALALRQLLGGASPWRRRTATAALGGARRRLTLTLPPEAETARAEVRATVEEIAARPEQQRRPALADAGLLVPHWAPPWGRDAGPVEQLVIDQELARARIRVPHLQVGAWAAPTIAAHGTPEQQQRWVRPTLVGDIRWCQLFSEPEAGSDLASLTTRATRTDGGWLLTGQKVWTTMAREADWGICLARTDPTAPKHRGITYFVVDMAAPGIDVRPLRELTGLAMFNEVFLTEVFVPDDCVVGEVGGGWPLARTTLANERVSMGSGSSFGGGVGALIALVAERIGTGELAADPLLLDRLGALVAEAHSLAVLGLRTTARSISGTEPGPEASVRKLLGAEHDQRTQEMGLELLGPEGATPVGTAGRWTLGFLANRCLTIAGGTSEIQRNVIGERLLGLPRDPEVT